LEGAGTAALAFIKQVDHGHLANDAPLTGRLTFI
jgi:hypothetical protein